MIVFDDILADMLSSKKLNPIVTGLYIRGRWLILFSCTKNIRPNSTQYFIMKIPNNREFQQITFNHSSDIEIKEFMNRCRNCTAKPYSFLVIDTTVASDYPLCFRKNILEWM